jgi:hypothetical protein
MGAHFDALVETVRNELNDSEKTADSIPAKSYLEELVRKSALFDFPLTSSEIRPTLKKDQHQYDVYLANYFEMSAQYNEFLITPFPITAIEDKDSVVVFDHLKNNEYYVTSCMAGDEYNSYDKKNYNVVCLGMVHAIIGKPDEKGMFLVKVKPVYSVNLRDGKRCQIDHTDPKMWNSVVNDLHKAVIAYIEQTVYIMDPENFILRKESKNSVIQTEKSKSKKKQMLRKTVMRPHYVVMSEEDTSDFMKGASSEPRPAHPVRGHWRRLMSDKFINKKGTSLYIKQYFTGNGRVEAEGGWSYEVMVKESPTKIQQYTKLRHE